MKKEIPPIERLKIYEFMLNELDLMFNSPFLCHILDSYNYSNDTDYKMMELVELVELRETDSVFAAWWHVDDSKYNPYNSMFFTSRKLRHNILELAIQKITTNHINNNELCTN